LGGTLSQVRRPHVQGRGVILPRCHSSRPVSAKSLSAAG
jgi:hypothetical protein